ncbi:hypothetical protein PR202_gb07623 [Eleusine coracana subsp. coracana]|uniref:Uncharacterized protein n=1 Tax=Eleusine coracana subsp. coracana TaxID=191504 RepID=A0AAV5EBZ7_ELECO|nr:hypothetical protein PR202_gb07623 [Eleusine coracana subsp. coracana]
MIGSAGNPDKYWGPHPKTGVFGTATVDAKLAATALEAGMNGGSVLDQKVWYRRTARWRTSRSHPRPPEPGQAVAAHC